MMERSGKLRNLHPAFVPMWLVLINCYHPRVVRFCLKLTFHHLFDWLPILSAPITDGPSCLCLYGGGGPSSVPAITSQSGFQPFTTNQLLVGAGGDHRQQLPSVYLFLAARALP